MGTIDQRLQGVLSYLCEKEGISPATLQSESGIRVWPENIQEIKQIRNTISYLKDYAKIQAIAKSIASQESVANDIEEAKKQLEDAIESTKKEIEELPKAPKKVPKAKVLYEFADGAEQLAAEKVAKAREERKNKLLELRGRIRTYKSQIKKLDTLKSSLSKPKKVVELLFSEEEMQIRGEYGKLVNLCVASMNPEFKGRKLVNKDGVTDGIFDYDEDSKTYTINHKNARHFLSILKAKKEIIEIANYAKDDKEYSRLDKEYTECLEDRKKYSLALEMSNGEKFADITDRMNEIMEMYDELRDIEKKSYKNNIRVRIERRIRKLFGLNPEIKIPKKIVNGRLQLARTIENFLNYTNKNREITRAFNSYLIAREEMDDEHILNYDQLKMLQHKLEGYGFNSATIPTKTVSVEELRSNIKNAMKALDEKLYKVGTDRKNAQTKSEKMAENLSPKAKKLLEEEGLENIVEYARKYYGFDDDITKIRSYRTISASAAAVILESILKRKNLSWDKMFEVYADSLGDSKTKEDTDLNHLMEVKMENIREKIKGMASIRTTAAVESVRE